MESGTGGNGWANFIAVRAAAQAHVDALKRLRPHSPADAGLALFELTQVRRPDVERCLKQFRQALAARGGFMPAGMKWSEARGFHYPSGGRTLRELMERQKQAARGIRMTELRVDETVVMGASQMAWRWARLFASGGALSSDASADERAGWQLHQLGFERPPLRVLERNLARSMR